MCDFDSLNFLPSCQGSKRSHENDRARFVRQHSQFALRIVRQLIDEDGYFDAFIEMLKQRRSGAASQRPRQGSGSEDALKFIEEQFVRSFLSAESSDEDLRS